jgi:hypothetical protein
MRRVVSAPVAKLAQLDAIRRITPGLICLIVAPLAVFASQRHRDADISASHFSLDYLQAVTRKNPGPRHEAEAKNSALGAAVARPLDLPRNVPEMPATNALYVSPERIGLSASSPGGEDDRGIYAGPRQP